MIMATSVPQPSQTIPTDSSFWSELVIVIVGAIIGGLVSFLIAWYQVKKAKEDIDEQRKIDKKALDDELKRKETDRIEKEEKRTIKEVQEKEALEERLRQKIELERNEERKFLLVKFSIQENLEARKTLEKIKIDSSNHFDNTEQVIRELMLYRSGELPKDAFPNKISSLFSSFSYIRSSCIQLIDKMSFLELDAETVVKYYSHFENIDILESVKKENDTNLFNEALKENIKMKAESLLMLQKVEYQISINYHELLNALKD